MSTEQLRKSDLPGNDRTGVEFRVYDKDRQITDLDELRLLDLRFQVEGQSPILGTHYEILENGSILCYPRIVTRAIPKKLSGWVASLLVRDDRLTVLGTVKTPLGGLAEASADVAMMDDLAILNRLNLVIMAGAALLLLGYLCKARFGRRSAIDWIYLEKAGDSYYSGIHSLSTIPLHGRSPQGRSLRTFLPFVRSSVSIEGINIYPVHRWLRKHRQVLVKYDQLPEGARVINLDEMGIRMEGGFVLAAELESLQLLTTSTAITLSDRYGIFVPKGQYGLFFVYRDERRKHEEAEA